MAGLLERPAHRPAGAGPPAGFTATDAIPTAPQATEAIPGAAHAAEAVPGAAHAAEAVPGAAHAAEAISGAAHAAEAILSAAHAAEAISGAAHAAEAIPAAPHGTEAIPGVHLRSATAADSPAVRAFLGGLSLDSAYRRFFTGLGSVPDSLVRRLLAASATRTVILAAAGCEIVGVADTTVVEGGAAVELGIVVADRWQGRGLGWPLADAALAPARLGGIRTLRAHTLPDNARVARILRRRWPAARSRFEDGTLIWDIQLTGPVARER